MSSKGCIVVLLYLYKNCTIDDNNIRYYHTFAGQTIFRCWRIFPIVTLQIVMLGGIASLRKITCRKGCLRGLSVASGWKRCKFAPVTWAQLRQPQPILCKSVKHYSMMPHNQRPCLVASYWQRWRHQMEDLSALLALCAGNYWMVF